MVETEMLATNYFYKKIPEFHRDFFYLSEGFSAHFLPPTKFQLSSVNTGITETRGIPRVNLNMSVSLSHFLL